MEEVTYTVRRSHAAGLVFLAACTSLLFGAVVPNMLIPMPEQASEPPKRHLISPSSLVEMLESAPIRIRRGPQDVAHLPPGSVQDIRLLYQDLGYDLSSVSQGGSAVPRVFLAAIPSGLKDVRETKVRKALFLRTLLPLILKVNEDILADRERLEQILERQRSGQPVHETDLAWMHDLSAQMGLKQFNGPELLRRLDIIPPSLALAQSAEESGWGTSRFARQGNALFGQWTWDHSQGIRPQNAAPGSSHAIRTFPNLLEAVRAYAQNLNSHRAYRELRAERERMRKAGEPISGRALAKTLTRYSERGPAYVQTLQSIIAGNNLTALDAARLSPAPVTLAANSAQ